MAKYYLWMNQGHGCDYTIACGQILIPLKAQNSDEAYIEAKKEVEYYGVDNELKDLKVFEVSETFDFLKDIYAEMSEAKRKRKEDEQRQKDLKKLEKLMKKYPGHTF